VSYTISLTGKSCPTCGHLGDAPDCPDPTYNLTPIFDFALTGEGLPNADVNEAGVVLFGKKTDRPRGLRLLDGKTGAESLALLNAALRRCADEKLRPHFISLNPPNGWGDFDGAVYVFNRLKGNAEAYPTHVWRVS
jgi:hypothetical protein